MRWHSANEEFCFKRAVCYRMSEWVSMWCMCSIHIWNIQILFSKISLSHPKKGVPLRTVHTTMYIGTLCIFKMCLKFVIRAMRVCEYECVCIRIRWRKKVLLWLLYDKHMQPSSWIYDWLDTCHFLIIFSKRLHISKRWKSIYNNLICTAHEND